MADTTKRGGGRGDCGLEIRIPDATPTPQAQAGDGPWNEGYYEREEAQRTPQAPARDAGAVAWIDAGALKWLAAHPRGVITTQLTARQTQEQDAALFTHPAAASDDAIDCCALAAELERIFVHDTINAVEAIAEDRTDAYWSGHAVACEEIRHRLQAAWNGTPDAALSSPDGLRKGEEG